MSVYLPREALTRLLLPSQTGLLCTVADSSHLELCEENIWMSHLIFRVASGHVT